VAWTLALSTLGGISQSAFAEGNISIAQQFGIGYLILDVVRSAMPGRLSPLTAGTASASY